MNTKTKTLLGTSASAGALGAATALGGKTALWAIFSAGPGAALAGAAETSAFLAWVGGGSLAAGGGGMAAGSAILGLLGPVGWAVAGAGAIGTGVAIYKSRKRRKNN
jgi:hypothetical protein